MERADGTTPVDEARLAAAHRATQLDPRIVRLFEGTFDTYEELAVELTKALRPDLQAALAALPRRGLWSCPG